MKQFYVVLAVIGVLLVAAPAQGETLPGVTDEAVNAALQDLSAVYGTPVVRVDQARAICNQEQYFLDCAEIGQKHDLFPDERAKQVGVLIEKLQGAIVQQLNQCRTVDCLVDVATSFSRNLVRTNPTVAQAVDLTPEKVKEKRIIIDTAESLGVDFEACRTMDPEVASVELLRSCARLAQDKRIQRYLPEETRTRSVTTEGTIALKEGLSTGTLVCGDGTLDGCGNFCLNPSREARSEGTSAIPPVCRQIAERFFGAEGIQMLESAYTTVQKTFDTYQKRAQSVLFTTPEGETLTSPALIGRYLEAAGERGDVAAVESGMDFLVSNGFVTSADRDFALSMIQRVRDRGDKGPISFDTCRENPESCRDVVAPEEQGRFATMGNIERIMRTEMATRGISDPSRCESDPALGEACMAAARAALPEIERIAQNSPEASLIVGDIKRNVRFGEEGIEARKRAQEHLTNGELVLGNQRFTSMAGLDEFCRLAPHQCLAEATRAGVLSRTLAQERYQYSAEKEFTQASTPTGRVTSGQPYPTFDREAALKQFADWLDNPNGPAPVPYQRPYMPYPQDQYPNQPYPIDPRYPTPNQPNQPYPYLCPQQSYMPPCPLGEYRQESRNEFGCFGLSACIPIVTQTQPTPIDGRVICPALPTVSSCPSGEERVIDFSSPQCGTYYSCRAVRNPLPGLTFPYTFANGRVVSTLEEGKNYCGQYGTGTGQSIAVECETKFGVVYQIQPPGGGNCSAYGSGWHTMDSGGNCFNTEMTQYRTPGGTLQFCSNTPVFGCSGSTTVTPPPGGQREQLWNAQGLRSWIRTDADSSRIESLKLSCANVNSSANVWMPGAGNSTSQDFGMPDPTKCRSAAACTASQYFDGASCVSGSPTSTSTLPTSCPSGQYWSGTSCVTSSGGYEGPPGSALCSDGTDNDADGLIDGADTSCQSSSTTCSSGQYWNGTSCVPSGTTVTGTCSTTLIGLLGDGCHNMGNAWFNSGMTSYVMPGGSVVLSCTTSYISGCTSGGSVGTSCPSGQYWNGSACVTSSSTTCPSGQYWSGSACVNSTGTGTTNCSQYGSGWHTMDSSGNCFDPAMQNYKTTNGTLYSCASTPASGCSTSSSQSCPSGQYWNGSSCVTSSSTTCPSGQYWSGSACVSSSSTSCPSGQYWNGSSCVTSSSTSCSSGQYWNGTSCVNTTNSDTTSAQSGCASAGGTWNSSSNYCQMPSSTSCPSGQYWSGSACVPSPTTSLFCPSNHNWTGSYCTKVQSPSGRNTASVFWAFFSIFGL